MMVNLVEVTDARGHAWFRDQSEILPGGFRFLFVEV